MAAIRNLDKSISVDSIIKDIFYSSSYSYSINTMLSFAKSKAKTVVDNHIYKIIDLNLYNSRGNIVFTISATTLRAGQQTSGHAHANESEVYEFVEGQGQMVLGDSTIKVGPGDYVFVEESKYHKVINISTTNNLIFKCYFNGEIKRPHLKN